MLLPLLEPWWGTVAGGGVVTVAVVPPRVLETISIGLKHEILSTLTKNIPEVSEYQWKNDSYSQIANMQIGMTKKHNRHKELLAMLTGERPVDPTHQLILLA